MQVEGQAVVKRDEKPAEKHQNASHGAAAHAKVNGEVGQGAGNAGRAAGGAKNLKNASANQNRSQKRPFKRDFQGAPRGRMEHTNHQSQYQQHQYQSQYQNQNPYQYQYQYQTDERTGLRKFTGRARLFVGNLTQEVDEKAVKELFEKFGEVGDVYLNKMKGFGFVRMDHRHNAEAAKAELDAQMFRGRTIRVRFATHGAAIRVKNISPFVSNELLEQSFSLFGRIERAVVIVDDKGKPTGDGIIEYENKKSAMQAVGKCKDGCFLLTSYPRPITVEPLEQKDEDDGFPEKTLPRGPQLEKEREQHPRFAQIGSFEYEIGMKWKEYEQQERNLLEDAKRKAESLRDGLEAEIESLMLEHQTTLLRDELNRRQEQLKEMEERHYHEINRRREMEKMRIEEERHDMMMMENRRDHMKNQMQQRPPNFEGPQGFMGPPQMGNMRPGAPMHPSQVPSMMAAGPPGMMAPPGPGFYPPPMANMNMNNGPHKMNNFGQRGPPSHGGGPGRMGPRNQNFGRKRPRV